jgi:hypothetical protein
VEAKGKRRRFRVRRTPWTSTAIVTIMSMPLLHI